MPFATSWRTLIEELEGLPTDSTIITPLSHERFQISDVQEHRIIIEFEDSEEKRPLQRDQFETLYHRIDDAPDGFELERLPPNADPYPAVLSLHPRFEIDEDNGHIVEKEEATSTQLLDTNSESETVDRTEPDLDIYADALLLVDAFERHDVSSLDEIETDALVNLYTLLSDVQRNANEFRQNVADVLLGRLHHEQPVSGPYGSVQRTTRRNRTLRDEQEILDQIEDAGIERERIMGVDRNKLDDALEVTDLSESDVYEVEKREYVRKANVDEEVKESRLQGLKEQLAMTEDEEANDLRQEIDALEARIDELTSFRTGTEMQD